MKNLFLLTLLFFPVFLFSQKISKKQIKKAKAHYELCINHIEKNNAAKALTEIESAISANPKEVEYHITKVNVLFELEEMDQGMGYLNRTVSLFPEEAEPYLIRASIFSIIREFESAIADFSKAIELAETDEDKVAYLAFRGGTKSQIMDFEGAYDDLMEAYKMDSDNKDVLNNLAMICDEIGKPDETLVYLNRIIELDSTYIPAYVNIGFKLQLMERHEEAVTYFNKAIKLAPNEALGYSNISYSLMKLGKLDEAMENINKSIDLNPINPYAYRNKALIYLEKKEISNACENIDIGLEWGFSKSYGDELEKLKEEHCVGVRN